MKRIHFTLSHILCLLAAVDAASAATNEITGPFQGVRLIHSRSTVPRLVDMYVVEIDMTAPGLAVLLSPSNGPLPGDTSPQTTRDFVAQVGAQIGVNGAFYNFAPSGQLDALGLSVSNGDAYSPFESGFTDALNISLDNVATIIRATGRGGTAHNPPTSLYNAVSGNTRLVTNGVNVGPTNPAIHPRTAAGVTADGKLLLFTVDGRNTPHSNGLTYIEMADVLIRWGARDAINLDGGSSTTLVMDNPRTAANDPSVLNIPSNVYPNGQPGQESEVVNNLAVFASRQTAPTTNTFVFADFEQGDESTWNGPLSSSNSNRGIIGNLSSADAVSGQAFDGQWSQRLTIKDDPSSDGGTENPGGAWFVRHLSSLGDPANNVSRPAFGTLGLWAKTSDPDLQISLVVDDVSGLTGDRGVPKNLIADNQWHLYSWQIDDANQWEAWSNGDGVVNEIFTLDSIQIFGLPSTASNRDAVIYVDAISHITPAFVPEPRSWALCILAVAGLSVARKRGETFFLLLVNRLAARLHLNLTIRTPGQWPNSTY
jgi:hypothetical protein